jgi:hypothetical protein
MAAPTQKWIAGVAWTSVFGTEVNSVVNSNAILSSTVMTNTPEDMFCDVSISLGSITPTGAPYIGIYIYPLNQDGTTYGDGRFGSSAAGPPPSSYFVGNIGINPAAAVVTGTVRGIILPLGGFKFVLHNGSGVTLAGSANTVKYQTYNISIG